MCKLFEIDAQKDFFTNLPFIGNPLKVFLSQPPFTCSKLTIETLDRGVKWRRSGIFIVNFEHISHLGLVFLLLTSNMCRFC